MPLHLVTYGIDKLSGSLRYIEEVPSGLACNCICPKCGSVLEAHKGNIQRHHFQHHSVAECKGAFESQIHLLSKAIIEENKALMLPIYSGRFCSFPQKQENFSDVFQECAQDDLQPDCLCKYQDEYGNVQTLWVEIFYSHAVDDDKARKIQERHITCLEIDVSQLFKDTETIDKNTLTDFLLNNPNNRHWINYPQGDEQVLAEAEEIRKQGNIIHFLKKYSNTDISTDRFQSLIYCLFSMGYTLPQKDYNSIYIFVKKHLSDYQSFNPIIQRCYVSAVQLLFCQLVVTSFANNNEKIQLLKSYCFNRKDIINALDQRVNTVIALGARQYRPQSTTVIKIKQPQYIVDKKGRFVKRRRL